jgi:hypothetical protein
MPSRGPTAKASLSSFPPLPLLAPSPSTSLSFLPHASRNKALEVLLASCKADSEVLDSCGELPLHHAIKEANSKGFSLLLAALQDKNKLRRESGLGMNVLDSTMMMLLYVGGGRRERKEKEEGRRPQQRLLSPSRIKTS